MRLSNFRRTPGAGRAAGATLFALIAIGLPLLLVTGATGHNLATGPVGLGTAGSFAVLAGAGITDVPTSTITGNVGLSPTTGAAIGLACGQVTGTIYAVDGFGPAPCSVSNHGLLTIAKNDLTTAFGDAAGRTATPIPGADNQLGGKNLTPGVYSFAHAATANLTGTLTLTGSSSSVWVFQAASDLVTASSANINFVGGARACNVFWEVNSSATLGTSTNFGGTILAATSITVNHAVHIDGRLLAETGAVTLDGDTVVRSLCGAASSGSTAGSGPDRELYCAASGQSYDLVVGENLLPPYNTLGLVPAYVNPVTGAKSCTFPVVTTVTAPTTTASTTTTSAPTPTSTTPTAVQKAATARLAAAAAAKRAATAKAATAKRVARAQRAAVKRAHSTGGTSGAKPATQPFGFSG